MKLKLLIITFTLSLLTACGGKKEVTDTKIGITVGNIASASLTPFTGGGGMLYGLSSAGEKFAINLVDVDGPLSLELPNGEWTLFGFLWMGDFTIAPIGGGPYSMSGDVRCGLTTVTLEGGEQSLSMDFNIANCDNSSFSPVRDLDRNNDTTNDGVYFPRITAYTCSSLDQTKITAASFTCAAAEIRGGIMSFKIISETFSEGVSVTTGLPLESGCIDNSGGTPGSFGAAANYLNVPQGNGTLPIKTTLRMYYDTGCNDTGARGYKDIILDSGLYAGDFVANTPNLKIRNYTNANTESVDLFTYLSHSEICATSQVSPGDAIPFSQGNGTNVPYGICFPWQFNSVGDDGTYLGNNFELLANLDFSQGKKFLDTGDNVPPCGDFATSIRPFGGLFTDAPTCSAPESTNPTQYTGTFNGNDYTINGAILFEEGYSRLGLFRNIGAAGVVKNLKITNTEVEGNSEVGIIAGISSGTIENIVIEDSFIEGDSTEVGGLVGTNTGNITMAILGGVEVSAKDANVGGITGSHATGTIISAYFNGKIEARDNLMPASYGGIAGLMNSGIIKKAASRGALLTTGIETGGLVGTLTTGLVINSYSNMFIHTTYYSSSDDASGNYKLGGLFGKASGGTVSNLYFAGKVTANCGHTTKTNCRIGNVIGQDLGATETRMYTTTNEWPQATYGGLDHTGLFANTTAGLRDSSVVDNTILTGHGWVFNNGDYPRHDYEVNLIQRPCTLAANQVSLATQIGNGRGSATNPLIICYPEQLSSVSATSTSNYHYKLEDHIPMMAYTTSGGYINSFSGNFNGNEQIIMGFGFAGGSVNTGFFTIINNTGVVRDTIFAGGKFAFDGQSTAVSMGMVAARNLGTITNVINIGSQFDLSSGTTTTTRYNIGYITGRNNGTVSYSAVDRLMDPIVDTSIDVARFGGIVGLNEGLVTKSTSGMYQRFASGPVYNMIGGIVGYNVNSTSAQISETSFQGQLDFEYDATEANQINIGGIAGLAQGGSISDSYTAKWSKIYVPNGTNVGGIVGYTGGAASVSNTYSAAEMIFGQCDDGFTFIENQCSGTWFDPDLPGRYGPIIGTDAGATVSRNYYTVLPYKIGWNGNVSSAAPVTTQCDVDATTDAPLEMNSYTHAFFGQHNSFFTITDSDPASDGTTDPGKNADFTIDLDTALFDDTNDCTGTNVLGQGNLTLVNTMSSNSSAVGTQVYVKELADMATYCEDTLPSSGANYVCSTGWDIVEDSGNPTTDLGFNRVMGLFEAFISGQPLPSNYPKWVAEPYTAGDYYYYFPEHGWNW